jgi:fatty-acyl-CoA synthase
MLSTVPNFPLTIDLIFQYGRSMFPDSRIVTYADGDYRVATFEQVATRADRLAAGLQRAGIVAGDRVGTLCWNSDDHMAAYYAIPRLGAVLHTLNLRLFPEQLRYVIDHGGDRVVIVDSSLISLLAPIADQLEKVERFVVVGDGDIGEFGERGIALDDLLAPPGTDVEWPEIDEGSAAALCYTSGTTGNPQGIAYGHRSIVLHSLASCSGNTFGLSEADRILAMVPMFHANAWGLPYSGWMVGADLIMPGPTLDAASLARMFREQRPTFTAGVPTLFNDLLQYGAHEELDLSSLRLAVCGGSPVPPALIDRFRDRHGVPMVQGWGMTETGPLCSLSHPPKGTPPEDDTFWRAKSGRPIHGVQARLIGDDGAELPWDGESVGEIEVRGPWVTGSYYLEAAPEKFDGGWLRTGDVGQIDPRGYIQITDRTKDVIKSGGEWVSSVELENTIMGHSDVIEAAVIGAADERWGERPLAVVVIDPDSDTTPSDLLGFLDGKVVRWWLPERWALVDEIPKTSVGKFDKRALRLSHERGELVLVEPAAAG